MIARLGAAIVIGVVIGVATSFARALPAADRLAEIPGVSRKLAMAIIAETGPDMTRFPTAAHLASWAGVAPSPASPAPAAGNVAGTGRLPQGLPHPRPPPAPPAPAPSSAKDSAACPAASAR